MSIVAIIVLVGLSAFFSSNETAIFTLPDDWVDEQATRGNSSGKILQELRQDPHRLLVTTLVGNTLST